MWSAANRYAVVLLLLVGIFCFFSLTQPDFFSRANLENLLTGSSILFVVSIGMTFVVLTGGIDLSVGSLLALSGIILSELFNDVGLPAPLAVLGHAWPLRCSAARSTACSSAASGSRSSSSRSARCRSTGAS